MAWTAFLEHEEAVRFFSWDTDLTPRARAEEWIQKQLLRYREKRFGLQALMDKSSGHFIGQCGLLVQEVDGIEELEVGYHIFPEFWNRGYASEAAIRFKQFAFDNTLHPSVISIIHIHNLRSQRVALQNGMQQEKQTRWNAKDVFIYRTENTGRK